MVNSILEKKWLAYLLWLVLAALFIFIYAQSPLQYDDYRYSLMYSAEQGCINQPVTSLGDYIRDVIEIYKGMEGRLANMLIALVMTIGGGKNVFNILAAAICCSLLWVMCRHFFGSCRFIPLLTVCTLLLWFVPAYGGCILWASGAVNYLWGSFILLSFFVSLRHMMHGGSPWPAAISGFCCGCYHEALSLPLLAAAASAVFFRKELRTKNFLFALLMLTAGSAVLIASPGIWHRADSGLSLSLAVVLVATLRGFISHVCLPSLLLVAVLWYRRQSWRTQSWRTEDFLLAALLFYNIGFATLVGYAGSWGGGYYYINFAMLLVTLRLIARPMLSASGFRKWTWCSISLPILGIALAYLIGMALFGRHLEDTVLKQAAKGERACVVDTRYICSERMVFGAPGAVPSSVFCKPAAYVQGIDHPYYVVLNDMIKDRSVYRNPQLTGNRAFCVNQGMLILRLPHGFLYSGDDIKGEMPDGRKCIFTRRMYRHDFIHVLRRYIAHREVLVFGVDYNEGTHYLIVHLQGASPASVTIPLMEESTLRNTEKVFHFN